MDSYKWLMLLLSLLQTILMLLSYLKWFRNEKSRESARDLLQTDLLLREEASTPLNIELPLKLSN